MGTGKTAIGRVLAKRLGFVFVDCDAEIEKEYGMTISEIFERFGESGFRDRESMVLSMLSGADHVVLATGGGAVLRDENRINLRKKGMIVCLTASPETILKRTKGNTARPLLSVPNPLGQIVKLLEQRRPYYEDADIVIETEGKGPSEVAQEILDKIKEGAAL
jgi:shikimate kinase